MFYDNKEVNYHHKPLVSNMHLVSTQENKKGFYEIKRKITDNIIDIESFQSHATNTQI